MATGAIRHDLHVVERIGAIGQRPEHRIGIVRIDVFADRDDDTCRCRPARSAAPCSARQISVRGTPGANCTNTTLRKLVSGSCMTTRRTPLIASVSRRCARIAAARRRRVFITLDSLGVTSLRIEAKTGDALARDRGDLHRHVEVFERDVAVAFAERPLRLEQFGVDQALDHDLGVGRHFEIDA